MHVLWSGLKSIKSPHIQLNLNPNNNSPKAVCLCPKTLPRHMANYDEDLQEYSPWLQESTEKFWFGLG